MSDGTEVGDTRSPASDHPIIPVLDHGAIRLVDHMASDQKVVGAARVSTGKGPEYTSKGPEADERLIRFLMSNGHGTPFEHAVFQFFVKCPIFVAREWQRHRIGSYNEQSGRYSEFTPVFYVPDHVRIPHPDNRQQSIRLDDDPYNESGLAATSTQIRQSATEAFREYKSMINAGVAREMARMILPVSTYTSFWWTVNARSLLNFLALRNAPDAQWEIQMYAVGLEGILHSLMPMTHDAFVAAGRRAP